MNKKTWIILIAALLVVGLAYVVKQNMVATPPVDTTNNPPTNTTQPVIATYFCTEGSIVATYNTGSVALALSDGRTLTLPQTVSGSGIRYEQGTAVFSSKGSNATFTENEKITFNNCLAGTQTTLGDINMFTDTSKQITFSYPKSLKLSSGEQGYTQSWMQNSDKLGLVLAMATMPKSYQPGTNFSEAKFTVGTSSDAAAVAACLTATNGGTKTGTVVIQGEQYTRVTESDAGAGNLYDTTSYRTVKNSQCYVIEYTIHSTQLGNYDPSQHITAYDKAKVTSVLEGIVKSFKFI